MHHHETSQKRSTQHPVRALLLLFQPTVLVLAALVVSIYWPVPAEVEIEAHIARTCPSDEIAELAAIPLTHAAIRYPRYPEIKTNMSRAATHLIITDSAHVHVIIVNNEATSCQYQVSGFTEDIRLQTADVPQKLTLNWFDLIKTSPRKIFLGVVIWMILTAISWVRLYNALH